MRASRSEFAFFVCLALLLAAFVALVFMRSLPMWCATPDKPHSGNWVVQPLCTAQLTAMGRVQLGLQSPTALINVK